MVSILKTCSTNHVFVFSKVALTKAEIGKEQFFLTWMQKSREEKV